MEKLKIERQKLEHDRWCRIHSSNLWHSDGGQNGAGTARNGIDQNRIKTFVHLLPPASSLLRRGSFLDLAPLLSFWPLLALAGRRRRRVVCFIFLNFFPSFFVSKFSRIRFLLVSKICYDDLGRQLVAWCRVSTASRRRRKKKKGGLRGGTAAEGGRPRAEFPVGGGSCAHRSSLVVLALAVALRGCGTHRLNWSEPWLVNIWLNSYSYPLPCSPSSAAWVRVCCVLLRSRTTVHYLKPNSSVADLIIYFGIGCGRYCGSNQLRICCRSFVRRNH